MSGDWLPFISIVTLGIGLILGATWAESEIVRARVRDAWRRGVEAGGRSVVGKRITALGADHSVIVGRITGVVPDNESDDEAAARLIRESGGRV